MQTYKTSLMPVLALRGLLVYPHMVLTFDVGRAKSVASLEQAMLSNQRVFLVSQKNLDQEDPDLEGLQRVGTVAVIRQVMNLPGDTVRVLAEGECRGELKAITQTTPYLRGRVRRVEDSYEDGIAMQALVRTAHDLFGELANASQRISEELADAVRDLDHPGELADVIAANVLTHLEDRQQILDELDTATRLEKLCTMLARETELADVEKQVQARIKKQIEKNQKDYYLREQIRAIQTELGDDETSEADDLRKRMEETPLNEEARKKCEKEIERLSHMSPGSPEVGMNHTYIEWILDLPWGKETEDNLNLARARKVLDEDHYGLEKVKERIVEYLAVLQMKKDLRGPILCFVGPPGVGKTSIVKGIAKTLERKFVQMSLGGVRDEAEIRGHRRTYIGSIPGRIISGMKLAGTMNPVFLFDEIDKMGADVRGDPASAMLEVLDAEQNHAFRDHYLEIPFDLSRVMFITTANSVDTIPPPLLDRMEVIEVPSYTEEEKLQIAKRHLLPKQLDAHGLKPKSVKISDKVMRALIEGYTREAGVRTLERTIARVVRKAAVTMLDQGVEKVTVTESVLHEYLGAVRFLREQPEKKPRVGVVNGLAWTSVGGELLEVECALMPGKGTLQLTGQLGDVMKESAEAAFTWVRAHSDELGLQPDFYKDKDIHIHAPEGAVPKDGPSAGVTMTTALVSALTGKPVRQDVAMTGEVTLRGRVLPIGGLKEKALAAYRAGIRVLVIPTENTKDLEEIPTYVLDRFEIVKADDVRQVLDVALTEG
ncbi:MAG: endopeptidase La [Clostridia bacterium]|nr:endopeptidase La [Clostridia bacterium]